jgi:hypothetical protein
MLLTAAETADKIRLTIPEEDARYIAARVDTGRLIMARETRPGEVAVTLARLFTGNDSLTSSDPRADKAAVAGTAMREGEICRVADTYTAEWDIPTIRAVRTHLLYGIMDENVAAGRLASDTSADEVGSRLYDELHDAERELRATYEASRDQPYPREEITVITGPMAY